VSGPSPHLPKAASVPLTDDVLVEAYVAACNAESDLQDAQVSNALMQAGVAAAMRKVLVRGLSQQGAPK
jgi:hypothetical protein